MVKITLSKHITYNLNSTSFNFYSIENSIKVKKVSCAKNNFSRLAFFNAKNILTICSKCFLYFSDRLQPPNEVAASAVYF